MKLFIAIVALASSAVAFAPADPAVVIMLGTGTPNPDPDRSGPSVAVIVKKQAYVVDAGPGVVRRAAQAARLGYPQLESSGLTKLFLTHLHSDHTAGYPDFIFTPAVTGRETALDVYGPPGTAAMTRYIRKAYERDLQIRLHKGLEPAIAAAYVVRPHEIRREGTVYETADVRIEAFAAIHGTFRGDAFGYVFRLRSGKTIVISGDTTYSDNLVRHALNCDVLIHEVYSAKALQRRTTDWQRYHSVFHTSAIDLGRIAAKVRPKVLILYHVLLFGDPPEQILSEIRQNFDGRIVYANDLDVWPLAQ
jgi:ribonuclease BN (tRNA processing enzyme)